ncbi:MAG: PspC domain-containing protein [Chloroflexi bacterium]|nr:PspC domain-containing protein [Chloroflexota bacterium]
MNRVTLINLAGRALYVEDDGAEAIDRWMEAARATLEGDPDRDELLADFEQAIGDRCSARTTGETDVVTTPVVEEILSALGPVEPAGTSDGEAVETEPIAAAETRLRDRQLYRLTGEDEGMIAGVCAGVAAYLNVDVTVVRVVTVIAALVSLGAVALVYGAMALIVPAASSPDERMAVRGYGVSAKEVMSRARENAGPALASVGKALREVTHVLANVIYWVFVLAIWVVLVAWVIAVISLFVDSEPLATAFDSGTSTWTIAIWVSSVFWLVAGVIMALAAGSRYLAAPSQRRNLGSAAVAVWFVFMTAAAISFVTIPVASSAQVRDLLDGEGRIEVFGETLCLSLDHGFERVRDTDGCDHVFSNDAAPRSEAVGHKDSLEVVRLTDRIVQKASDMPSLDAT